MIDMTMQATAAPPASRSNAPSSIGEFSAKGVPSAGNDGKEHMFTGMICKCSVMWKLAVSMNSYRGSQCA